MHALCKALQQTEICNFKIENTKIKIRKSEKVKETFQYYV